VARPKESVWDYPRPSRLEPARHHLEVVFFGKTVAETRHGLRVLETSSPPTYYFPRDDVVLDFLRSNSKHSLCEFKGRANYWDVVLDGSVCEMAAWSYPTPTAHYAQLRDYFAFYPGRAEACLVDGERVVPQMGDFYGGWITSWLTGPFKGAPGTEAW
jgi:uncharacterized protein (DUF427 family)